MWTWADITVDRFISQSDYWICSEYLRLRRNLAGHFEVRERCLTLTGTCPLVKFTESLTQLADLHTFYEKKYLKVLFFVINHRTVWLVCLLFYILLRHLLRNCWKTFEYSRHSDVMCSSVSLERSEWLRNEKEDKMKTQMTQSFIQ